MALGFFNLLPVFPLDGGRVAICYLSNKINKMLVYKIMKYICLFFSLLFLVLFVISIFNSINLTFMFTSVFLFFSCFGTDENVYFERSLVLCNTKQISTPVEVKTFVVNKDVSVYQLAKCVSGNYFTVFKVVDSDNNIIKTISIIIYYLFIIKNNGYALKLGINLLYKADIAVKYTKSALE